LALLRKLLLTTKNEKRKEEKKEKGNCTPVRYSSNKASIKTIKSIIAIPARKTMFLETKVLI